MMTAQTAPAKHPGAQPATPVVKQPSNGATPATPPPFPSPHLVQLRWLHEAVGKEVRVRFLDGKVVAGELMEFDQYSLTIWPSSAPSPMLVYKHAVALIAPTESHEHETQREG